MSANTKPVRPLMHVDASKSEDYYRHMVENLPAAVYTCDADGYIRYYNQSAADLWGRAPEVGKDLWCGSWKIYHPDGAAMPLSECPMAVALKERRPVMGEEIIVERPDGERRYILPHPRPIYNSGGVMVGAMNMLVDITESKRTQEAARRLQLYNEQLEEFAYAASHDLQEPLRKINTFASLLAERYGPEMDDAARKYLVKISESSARMKGIILDLLAYTRESRVQEQLEPTDLNAVVEAIKADLELLMEEKGATLTWEGLPVIRAVPAQIDRLFYNLINNSLKFCREGVPPVITIACRQKEDTVEITVQDNGIGFKQAHAEKIFDLFQRLNNGASYAGNGIGLSLCRKIVTNHRGEISAVGVEGEGATFCITLPKELVVGA